MGRTLGPFTDVSTARVDGAYEIYRGEDDDGREVEILTLGATSAKDPARRALLSDTVAWAHATRGPADASILSADLDSDQPYVVTLRQDGMRGVERMLERMLAMGPPSGPLSGVNQNSGQFPIVGPPTGHIPVVTGHTDPHGIPRVVSTPPSGSPVAPASPMASYVTKAQTSRPPWLVPMAVVLLLLVLIAGGFFVFYGMSGEDSDGTPGGGESGADDQNAQEMKPSWDDSLPPVKVVGDQTYTGDEGETIALARWPFAFKVTPGMTCEQPENLLAECAVPDQAEDTWAEIQVQECPDGCGEPAKNKLVNAFDMPGEEERVDANTQIGNEYFNDEDLYHVGMTRFYEPEPGHVLFVTVFASGNRSESAMQELHRIVNSVATQTSAV
ncbi:hypothetical protein [Stackebrandtia nassauensis]|uniref:Serine/threonine protein kinase n=1 Tax=Stackebrandtia nassauensis (strain DSM 44728 / CIP 108903 / NRRL B-16338 / NBRC 102104 / LLR-40K-21) TaxID=446470 RepID=D3Q4C5_STANL|nr:hypothetical protein [Stackebrandtia nassauensis]ADD40085.1 hypothetical protein Snas_0368 [Stackebrandtia nassauensis DSM 44728]